MVRRLSFMIFSPLRETRSRQPLPSLIIFPIAAADPGGPEDREEREDSSMPDHQSERATPEAGGLLVAKRRIIAARTRSEQESDVSSGRSDGND
jgi:hypothetical protein